jgi:hypothetical protein
MGDEGTSLPFMTSALDGSGQLHAPVTLLGRGEEIHGTHCIRGWVGPRMAWTLWRIISCPSWQSNHHVQTVTTAIPTEVSRLLITLHTKQTLAVNSETEHIWKRNAREKLRCRRQRDSNESYHLQKISEIPIQVFTVFTFFYHEIATSALYRNSLSCKLTL